MIWTVRAMMTMASRTRTAPTISGAVSLRTTASCRRASVNDVVARATSAPLIVGAVLVLLAIVIIARTVQIIQQGYVGIVKRLGEFHSVRQPGVTFLVPLVDSMVTVDIRETPRTGDKQDVITRDNVTVSVNATIFSQVVDPRLALFSVSNYFVAIDQLSRTTLRAIFGGMSLDDALSQRERINAQLQAQMESVTDKWGIRSTESRLSTSHRPR